MNAPRFYSPEPLSVGACVTFSASAARHAVQALRLRPGDDVILFDGRGGDYPSRLLRCGRGDVAVEVLAWRDSECESPLDITLIQALQAGEKMDFTVQKAVELGARRIVPVATRRSVMRLDGERAQRRMAHWRAVAVSACEQCGRNRIPEIAEPESLRQWLARTDGGGTLRLMLDPRSPGTLRTLTPPVRAMRVELLIGAEGGLAPEESEWAAEAGFIGIRLGPRVLRTETAGLAALAAIQCLWGDFGGGTDHV